MRGDALAGQEILIVLKACLDHIHHEVVRHAVKMFGNLEKLAHLSMYKGCP